MGVVTKSHPYGFIIRKLFHIEQIRLFLSPYLKITSGEISAKEGQRRTEQAQWVMLIRNNQNHLQIKITSIAPKKLFKNQDNPSSKPVRQNTNRPIIQSLITPTLRSASGQGERPGGSPGSPDAPRSARYRMEIVCEKVYKRINRKNAKNLENNAETWYNFNANKPVLVRQRELLHLSDDPYH